MFINYTTKIVHLTLVLLLGIVLFLLLGWLSLTQTQASPIEGTVLIRESNLPPDQKGTVDPEKRNVQNGEVATDTIPLTFEQEKRLTRDPDNAKLYSEGIVPDLWTGQLSMAPIFADSGQTLGTAQPGGVALGDLDGDNDLDAFVTNYDANNEIWKNDGTGVFNLTVNNLGGNVSSEGVTLGDIDGDGDLDAVESIYFANNRVWLNDGTGIFTESQSLNDLYSKNITLGDLDGDGDLDMFVANTGADTVWANDGTGTFTIIPNTFANYWSFNAALEDLDNDGDLDAVIATERNQYNPVYFNDGSGVFIDTGQVLGTGDSSIAIGDVDGDGDPDAVIGQYGGTKDVWLNDGSGVFNNTQIMNLAESTNNVYLGDMDEDGDPDLFVSNLDNQANTVWINDGTGTFSLAQYFGNSESYISALGDLNGDNRLDLFEGNGYFSPQANKVWFNITTPPAMQIQSINPTNNALNIARTTSVSATFNATLDASTVTNGSFFVHGEQSGHYIQTLSTAGSTAILTPPTPFKPGEQVMVSLSSGIQNNGGDSVDPYVWQFVTAVNGGYDEFVEGQTLGSARTHSLALGDLNGDGDLDVFVVNNGANNEIWQNDGLGTFNLTASDLGGALESRGIALGDIDGDGDLDAVEAIDRANNKVWQNDGTGTFVESQSLNDLYSYNVTLGDIDGDGDLDIFAANNGYDTVWANDGAGSFTPIANTFPNFWSFNAVLGDVDNDGDLDAVVAALDTHSNPVYFNDGTGVFIDTGQTLGAGSASINLGDLDNDGDLDGVIGRYGGPNEMWLNDGSGTFNQTQIMTLTETTNNINLGDIDGDGDLDLFVNNLANEPNTLWLNDGTGVFSLAQSFGASESYAADLGDLNGDGRLDIVVGNGDFGSQPNKVWFNKTGNPALVIDKQVNLEQVYTSDLIEYTILVTNTGDIALQATIVDTLPPEVTPTGSQTWTDVIIPVGGAWTQILPVTINKGFNNKLTNIVKVTTLEGVTNSFTHTTYTRGGRVHGFVYEETGTDFIAVPVVGATVNLRNKQTDQDSTISATTDAQGRYMLPPHLPGEYYVCVAKTGYISNCDSGPYTIKNETVIPNLPAFINPSTTPKGNKADTMVYLPIIIKTTRPNTAPAITSVVAKRNESVIRSANPGETVQIEVIAEDADGDELTYEWITFDGQITSGSDSVPTASWTLLDELGNNTVTVNVSDGKDSNTYDLFLRTTTLEEVFFNGVIYAEDLTTPIANATISINNQVAQTSSEGGFELLVAEANRYVINVNKSGYAPLSNVHYGPKTELTIQLMEADILTIQPTSVDYTLQTTKTEVAITGELIDQDGNVASTDLTVALHVYASNDIQGDYGAVDSNGNPTHIQSYGAVSVDIRDDSGNSYNLHPDAVATLTLEIAPKLLDDAPNTVTLLSYNEETGLWEEDGTATLVRNKYIGTISHLSSWTFGSFATGNFRANSTGPSCVRFTVDETTSQYPLYAVAKAADHDRWGLRGEVQTKENLIANLDNNIDINFWVWSSPYAYFTGEDPVQIFTVNTGEGIPYYDQFYYPYAACKGQIDVTLPQITPYNGLWLSRKTDLTQNSTAGSIDTANAYYQAINAPATLDAWKTANNFTSDGVEVIFLNKNSLNFAHQMHCQQTGTDIACYGHNFLDPFGLTTAIGHKEGKSWARANSTFAMVYNQADGIYGVKFYAYDYNGNLVPGGKIDSQTNKYIPQTCMACHGGDYNTTENLVENASFLPFDPSFFDFKTGTPPYQRSDQEENIRQLNEMVKNSNPNGLNPNNPIGQYIDTLYPDPGGVHIAGNIASDTIYPGNWKGGGDPNIRGLYNTVIRPYCQSCHLALPSSIDWTSRSQCDPTAGSSFADMIDLSVNQFGSMPHSEIQYKKFQLSEDDQKTLNDWLNPLACEIP